MKKSLMTVLAAGMLAAGAFPSCSDSDETDKINTLTVSPEETISFRATKNEPVRLTITTDAETWAYTAPEWVLAEQSGNTLEVNAQDNPGESSRSGRIEITAGNAEAVAVNVTQSKRTEADDDALSVTPSDDITFRASGNDDVVLKIETTAATWEYEVPEWVTAEKSEKDNTLTLNARNNSETSTRTGRITITAGTAEPVMLNVLQQAGDGTVTEGTEATLEDSEGGTMVEYTITSMQPVEKKLSFRLEAPAEGTVEAELYVDEAYVEEYNFLHKTDYQLYPASEVTIADGGTLTIEEGGTAAADVTVNIETADPEKLRNNVEYMLPLYVKAKTDNVSVSSEKCRANYILQRQCKKTVKNIYFCEVNSTNPLNALEVRLADGSMFFDAVVLFSANIRYNYAEDMVYLHNNPNVQTLLEKTDTYLQPLRRTGIKVYLCLMGDHTPAGVANLTRAGAEMFAEDVANAIAQYKLDGVALDDEYTEGSASTDLIGGASASAASRVAYELKKAMKEKCSWPTEVCTYQYGTFRSSLTSVDGMKPGEFIDITVPNYNEGPAFPYTGMLNDGCAIESLECNLQRGNATKAYQAEAGGYGWMMFFAYDPSPTSNIENYDWSMDGFRTVAAGLYDEMKLVEPTGYYIKKNPGSDGEGDDYDPTRYEFK